MESAMTGATENDEVKMTDRGQRGPNFEFRLYLFPCIFISFAQGEKTGVPITACRRQIAVLSLIRPYRRHPRQIRHLHHHPRRRRLRFRGRHFPSP